MNKLGSTMIVLATASVVLLTAPAVSLAQQSGGAGTPPSLPSTPHQQQVIPKADEAQPNAPGTSAPVGDRVQDMPATQHQRDVLKSEESAKQGRAPQQN